MTTLAADKPREYKANVPPLWNDVPVIADDIIYEGALVGESSSTGTARPFVASDTVIGFAHGKADNAGGSAGDVRVRVRTECIVKLTVVGAASDADYGAAVYATDDDTFTLTSSGATQIGKVFLWVASTTCWVFVQGAVARSI